MANRTRALSKTRLTHRLNSRLERNLCSYAAAATAACLALATSANAKIVYTAANTTVTEDTYLDLNGDGLADFRFAFDGGLHGKALVIHPAAHGNGALCSAAACIGAAAGSYGNTVGPNKVFVSNTLASTSVFVGAGVWMANAGSYAGIIYFGGPWAGVTKRYLGLKFLIGGKVHFGWARLNVGNWQRGGTIKLTGYAYETTANTKILEGHETGTATEEESAMPSPSPSSATLGALAEGANALAIWRREQQ